MTPDPESELIVRKGAKLKNRRVFVGRYADGGFLIETHRLVGWKDVKRLRVRLSKEAGRLIMDGLQIMEEVEVPEPEKK